MIKFKENIIKFLLALLFFASIILISFSLWIWVGIILGINLVICIVDKSNRMLSVKILFFIIGFSAYRFVGIELKEEVVKQEYRILLDRLLLVFIIASLWLSSIIFKQQFFVCFKKPEWENRVYFPYIWRGFHSLSVFQYLVISVTSSAMVFIPFILMQGINLTYSMILFSVTFSIINGFFEEIIWRGAWLGGLKERYGIAYAVFISSIGFGLQHMSIGIPVVISILFSVGGFFFSVAVLKSNSIYPSIVWHCLMNLGMVYCGMIL